jgi:serine/threonine protein kinase
MKVLSKQNIVKRKQVQHTKTERKVLGTMNHPFIVKLHYAFQVGRFVCTQNTFVTDCCCGFAIDGRQTVLRAGLLRGRRVIFPLVAV